MIQSVYAKVLGPWDEGIFVAVGPVKMSLITAHSQAQLLLEDSGNRREVFIVVELSETNIFALGFDSTEARTLYLALKQIDGIGRKTALKALESEDPIDILRAVTMQDRKFLTSLEGLGAKRVAALIDNLTRHWHGVLPQPVPCKLSEWIAAREVLVSKGLTREKAEELLFQEYRA